MPDTLAPDAGLQDAAGRIAAGLEDTQLAAQVILTGIDGNGAIGSYQERLLREAPVGGVMLFRYNLALDKSLVAPFLAGVSALIAANAAGIPPFVAVDHEGGLVHRFGDGVERLPAAYSYWELAQLAGKAGWEAALARIEADARRSGAELRSLGISLNLAPVAEPLGDENRAFLGDRSYGPDPRFVEQAAGAFIRGMEGAGVFCVVKHFPGNATGDPHQGAVVLTGSREYLDLLAAPMEGLMRSGTLRALMVSHALVPAWDAERTASLSPAIMGGWLRGELGFGGLLVADDFSMGAAAASGFEPVQAAVEALIAGADLVMTWPKDLAALHSAILEALRQGRLSRERLVEAASRIILLKMQAGLMGED
jgi:beta-N-acetylhexosaminidase